MMEKNSGQLNLGSFNFRLLAKWAAQFFPSAETKLRLVKNSAVVIVEHYLMTHDKPEISLDEFHDDHVLDLQRSVNGAIFYDEEDTGYEILAENNGEFFKYFFLAEGNFVFRFTLSGSWDTADEDEIREMMSSLTLTDDAPMPAEKTGLAPFEIDFQDWLRVGAMYSRMASS